MKDELGAKSDVRKKMSKLSSGSRSGTLQLPFFASMFCLLECLFQLMFSASLSSFITKKKLSRAKINKCVGNDRRELMYGQEWRGVKSYPPTSHYEEEKSNRRIHLTLTVYTCLVPQGAVTMQCCHLCATEGIGNCS